MDILPVRERRRFPRIDKCIFIFCQLTQKENINTIKGFTDNISAGGLMFEADRSIPCTKHFILEIYQPQGESQDEIISLAALAKVKWVKPIDTVVRLEGSNKFQIGIEFINVDDKIRQIIANYVQRELNA